MKILLILALSLAWVEGMTEKEILNLNKKDHDNIELIKELTIFPKARETSTAVSVESPGNFKEKSTLTTKSKHLQGKYIIHETTIKNEHAKVHLINVITYSPKDKRYKMWTRSRITVKDKEPFSGVAEYDGLHIKGSDYITWSQIPIPGKKLHSVIISKLKPDGEHWISYDYNNGKLTTIMEGIDKVIK